MERQAWFIEGYVGESRLLRRFQLREFPFVVGRDDNLPITLNSARVSRRHAQFDEIDGQLRLRDLDSTNGTFVNRQRIHAPIWLDDGDIVHFADQEFRVIGLASDPSDLSMTCIGIDTLPQKLPQGAREFQLMLLHGAVTAVFQPIVDMHGAVIAHEALGRGAYEGLPSAPWPLFQIAESLELAVPFSNLLRERALEIAARFDPTGRIFFNIHPHEIEYPEQLLKRMDDLRERFPNLGLVLEVHEGAVTSGAVMRQIGRHLRELSIGLGYDDFGAGQARLIELTEVPPDYVKFDMGLIRGIDQATLAKRQMLELFQRLLADLGIATLAEGIETEAEFRVLQELGIGFYQGYYFGRPGELIVLSDAHEDSPESH